MDKPEDKCYFDKGNKCSALIRRKCAGCKFRKNWDQYIGSILKSRAILKEKGLEAQISTRLGEEIVTTRKREYYEVT